ncbi:DEAD/DEAH box helicase [Robiginitomaculum antarcticum]|uniref:DEAD/DEAH box helicase n=1 Tax=Robiginitomaculum antarcticum TaxID=437507 RepID=UPI0009FD502B|nr:DEAD/DEAH box helicase [Robiginitomaculum antarcticum]
MSESTMKFSDFNLAEPLALALKEQGYTTPTPIQAQSIPFVMAGHDVLGVAQTGTGKTASFALPVLHHIFTNPKIAPKRGCRVLVLAPTRELASQIAVSFETYGSHMPIDIQAIYGGVSIQRQIKKVVSGNDVIVATPGRLIDLIDQKLLTLKDVEVLILDEADQMMDMGFIHALRKIAALVPKQRQTLFFSATMPGKIKKLGEQFLTDPKRVSVSPESTTAERVIQTVIFVNQGEKLALLANTLNTDIVDRALVFTRTKHGADRVVKKLWQAGIDSVAIHGNKSQGQRKRALDMFRDGTVKVMIATDVAARGIDIEGISHVINYELPNVPEQYVHRIGRTARAGREGRAIAYCAKDERAYLKDIEKQIKQRIDVEELPENFLMEVARIKSLPPPSSRPPSAAGVQSETPSKRSGRGKSRNKNRDRKPADKGALRAKPDGDNSGRSKSGGGYKGKSSSSSQGGRSKGPRNDEQGFRKRKPKSERSDGDSSSADARPAREPRPYIKAGESSKSADKKPDGSQSEAKKGDFKFNRKPRSSGGKPKPGSSSGSGRSPDKRGPGSRPRNAGGGKSRAPRPPKS